MPAGSLTTAERVRYALEDSLPAIGLPAAELLVGTIRGSYRRYRRRERAIAHRLSPNLEVTSGPFAGMRYTLRASGSALLPKLAGTYEAEIAEDLERLMSRRPRLVIDVGAAEGYYAVGFARRLPDAEVVAFESRRSGRWLSRELARANGVAEQLVVRGYATVDELARVVGNGHGVLTVFDIDGGEQQLVDPQRVPGLARAMVVVETHDHLVRGVTDALSERFGGTHDVVWRASVGRDPMLLPDWERDDARFALDERRPPQGWLVMYPRS